MTWIPPYAVTNAFNRLKQQKPVSPSGAVTHIGLQFWMPTTDGGVQKVQRPEVSDATIRQIVKWAHQKRIRVLLCVYNAGRDGKWDWSLARAAFRDNQNKFIKALIKEMNRYKLDGIDVDLEGVGDLNADKDSYVRFIAALASELRRGKKEITVDTFAYTWHAPNQTWWPELLPHVDGLTTMGYTETGAAAPGWRSYAEQAEAAGAHRRKLQIGIPSFAEKWQGSSLSEHLDWIARHDVRGVAIWDAQFKSSIWNEPAPWRKLETISTLRTHRR
jgi:spore germination protein YaaH